MHRVKLAAVFTVAIFVIGLFAVAIPVQAHFTLGNLTSTYRFHSLDYDPHVPGVIGYVWPGGGLDAYAGFPNFASSSLSPGYQSPYPCRLGGEPLGIGGTVVGSSGYPAQCNPGGAPTSSWYQLQGSGYAPFGSVLAGSTGDLIFAFNATATSNPGGCNVGGTCRTPTVDGGIANDGDKLGWSKIIILLPPGFMMPGVTTSTGGIVSDGSNVVTTITNSYANIQVYRYFAFDRYAPGWTAIQVGIDGGQSAVNNGGNGVNSAVSYYDHQFINFTSAGEWYYVRINGVTAPDIAGRYFFKIQLVDRSFSDSNYLAGPEGTATNSTAAFPGEAPTQFIPTQNWPVLLVKGEIDPAIVTGTVRYAGYNSTVYGQPVGEAGRVYAHMETKIDPYTGQQITQCPPIGQPSVPGCTDAMGYFNATATGHYEVEGVAPGIYTLYAQAAGFPTQVCASEVTVLKGQSLHFDCYVQPGPVIHGNVYTKHQFGDEPWMGELPPCSSTITTFCSNNDYNEYIKIELYDAPTLGNIPLTKAGLVSWSPVPCVAGGQDVLFTRSHAGSCGDPRFASRIAFPWHEYTPCNGYRSAGAVVTTTTCVSGNPLSYSAFTQGYYQVSESSSPDNTGFRATTSTLLQDPQGVGPPQSWFVRGGTTIPFHFEFGLKAEYGAPRDLDGMVPQVYATWVNGLTPGRYYARAWVFRYVQTALDGSTFQEYYFDVTPQEWAGDVTLPIDLRLSSWVNKTVHFHDQINSLIEDPINTGAGFMTGWLMGTDGNVYSYNQTALGIDCLSATNPTTECAPGVTRTGPGIYYANKGGGGGWYISDPNYGGVPGSPAASPGSGVSLDPFHVNGNAIQEGRANIQFWGINDTWSGENYGLPSGTYSPFTQVLGYVAQGPAEQVSVTLSGTPTSISDHMVRGPGFNVTLYSIDWERPTVNRAWEFGNPEGWNLVPGFFANQISGSSRSGYINSNSVGAEIDLGAYMNGTIVDWTGDEPVQVMASSIQTTELYQNQFENNVTLNGGGFAIANLNGALFDANMTWFGSDLKRPGNVGGFLVQVGGPNYSNFHNVNKLFIFPHQLEPTAFQPGEYYFGAFTYGYIQDQTFSVYAGVSQIADVRINLMVGVNITLDILFKKEHVITPTSFNMSGRVRIFNDQGQLVGEWLSSNGAYTPITGRAVAADGSVEYPFGPLRAAVPQTTLPPPNNALQSGVGSGLNEYNFVPGGVSLLHVTISGLPQVPAAGYDAPVAAPLGAYSGDPIFTPLYCDFSLVCMAGGYAPNPHLASVLKIPGTSLTYPFPYTGIAGYPDYQGGWTAEVDFVPWYNNNTNTQEASSGGLQSRSAADAFAQYYTPVNGLLLGESYHIIPGTTATSSISLTEDAALSLPRCKQCGPDHSLVFNHLGPYSQQGVWQMSGTHLSGEASGIFEVDLNGFISGTALAFTWANDFRPLSWATVSVTGASGATWNYYTSDGLYGMYLPGGSYSLTIASPGIASQTLSVAVTGGEVGTAGNVYMQQSNIPVPEFTNIAIVAFSALAASAYIRRRRR